ncbi:MAG: FprA family A-type flavoprotein [Candidatus Aminicenantes bacterium]|nr:FprA family A-type flavoprotein [Candidatus Aminicenantes bacterium]
MTTQEIVPKILSVGVKDWDRRLFDELIPLPDGTTYNSYLILGSEKTALIDTVDPAKSHELISNLEKAGAPAAPIDYVIANHAEQDHSGSIPAILDLFPNALVVTNEKCKGFLEDLLHIAKEKFLTVKDGESLSLGDKTLQFHFTPWVHWPETMVTYLKEDKILFSCDFFGSHLADSRLFVQDEHKVLTDAKRYYAEIMMPFRVAIKKNIEKIETLDVRFIAPSHGPVYNNPRLIIDAYKDWISHRLENTVVVAYVSMHGSTRHMVDYLVEKLIAKGITVKPFNLTRTDLGDLAMALVDAATVVIGAPTVLAGPHPAAVYAASLVNALKPKTKYAAIIGSYGWGGKTVETIVNNLNNLKLELLEPVLCKGHPREKDFQALDRLADEIAAGHKTISV